MEPRDQESVLDAGPASATGLSRASVPLRSATLNGSGKQTSDPAAPVTMEFAPPTVSVDNEFVELESAGTPEPPKSATPQPQPQPTPPPPAAETKPAEPEKSGPKLLRKKKKAKRRWDAPAWAVSAVVHLGMFAILAVFTVASEEVIRKAGELNTALVGTRDASEEPLKIYADPSEGPRDQTVGDTNATSSGLSLSTTAGVSSGIGTGPPSATPVVGGRGSGVAAVGEGRSLPQVKVVGRMSGLSVLPSMPGRDLGGGGGVAGDVMFGAADVGVALDQLAREILRHLTQHKVTVVWLFDESESMKDDQRAIRDKFTRVTKELNLNVRDNDRNAPPLSHAIVGFGQKTHFELEKPTSDIEIIGKSIDRLRVDPSGIENTNTAILEVMNHYGGLIRKDRRLVIVLVTDEAGDDGAFVEEALQAARTKAVPIYVIGRQSPFGYPLVRHRYVDPVTNDTYWPTIRRGPETADLECLQWDGLHDRWEEQPSGFAPYELARLAKETGGIFFLLPTEEEMRARQREKAYSIKSLKEYVPAYESRGVYGEKRLRSELRRTMFEIINVTRDFPYRRHYPVDPGAFNVAAQAEFPVVTDRLNTLVTIEKKLKSLKMQRDREPEKRWQAHYDLMLAQVVAYQIQAYEYRATLKAMMAKFPKPSKPPTADVRVEWVLDHSTTPRAPKSETEKKYVEATKLLKDVIAKHPTTPWSDLAQDELNRGFSVGWSEWRSNPKYDERAKFVPKY